MSAIANQAPSTAPAKSAPKPQNLKRKFIETDSDDEVQILEMPTCKSMKMDGGKKYRPSQTPPSTVGPIEIITISDDEDEAYREQCKRIAALSKKRKAEKEENRKKCREEREKEAERRAQKEREARKMRMEMATRRPMRTRENCHKTRIRDWNQFF